MCGGNLYTKIFFSKAYRQFRLTIDLSINVLKKLFPKIVEIRNLSKCFLKAHIIM